MKYIKYPLIFLLLAALFLGSCSKNRLEVINTDPNSATDAPLNTVLVATLSGLIQPQEGENARLACIFAQQFTGTDRQYSAFNVYEVTAGDIDWDGEKPDSLITA